MATVAAELYTNSGPNMDLLQSLGVGFVRLDMNWGTVAPDAGSSHKPSFDASNPNGYPAMAQYDALIRGLAARHIGVDLALVGRPPLWAEGPGAPHPGKQSQWKPSAADYADFVHAVGTRYSGHFTPQGASHPLPRIDFWSVWNEPNIGNNLAPETPHVGSDIEIAPMVYRGLLNAAWTSLHQTGHGADRILIGELAPAGATFKGAPGPIGAMAPLRWLRALYCVDATYQKLTGTAASERGCPTTSAASAQFAAQNPGLFKASGVAVHPYSFTSLPPNVPIPNEPDYAELALMPHVEATLDRLQRVYGSSTKFPIWSTEFGYITNPPNPQYTVNPALAAQYINWAEYLSWRDPRIRSYDQFLLADAQGQEFATGLQTSTGAKKPTYDAYRMPLFLPRTTAPTGSALEVWGDVRPAKFVPKGKRAAAEVQFRSRAGAAWKTIVKAGSLSPQGYFDVLATFPGSGFVRTRWVYPDGEAVTSRTVAIALH